VFEPFALSTCVGLLATDDPIISGVLHGRVSADQLTINGNGVLADPNL
jgi:hypothetical protein